MLYLTPNDVLDRGLALMRVRRGRKSYAKLLEEFQKHFGSSPLDIAEIWLDLCQHDANLLHKKEKTEKGFKRYLTAMYWLWARPKNAALMSSRLSVCVDYCQGRQLWKWIERIATLETKKIFWDESLDAEDTEVFAISADGVDFKAWEMQHPDYPVDTKAMSHKFRSCGIKYLIVLSVFRSRCVHIEGPFKGGVPDLDMFRETGLIERLKQSGKLVSADRGFRSKYVDERNVFTLPDYMDSKELHSFKSRSRLRQETFNRRLKHFESMSSTFKNGFVKHGVALRAVATIVQYQMDNGSPLFCV